MTNTAKIEIQVGSYRQVGEERIWEPTAGRDAELSTLSTHMLDDSGNLTESVKEEMLFQVRKNLDIIRIIKEEDVVNKVAEFRKTTEDRYEANPTGCGGSFGEILCYELHDQPINPRMETTTISGGYDTGLTFKELADKWGIPVRFLGELIADHCDKL